MDKGGHVHMDQDLDLEVGMVDEGWEGTYMGLDNGMEKMMTHNYPLNTTQNSQPLMIYITKGRKRTQILIFNTKGS